MGVISKDFAQKFIDKTAKNLNFNINVMNEKGVIIASKDQDRIGDFHEVAYNLLNGKMVNGTVRVGDEEKFINTKAGVNMFINYKNEQVGVICVTGDPNEVESFAELVKTSMETMLEYELQQKDQRKRRTDIEQFLYYLLFEENIEMDIARNLADNIHFRDNIYRLAIIIRNNSGMSNKEFVKSLQETEGYSKLDLITIARNNNIVMLKYVGEAQEDKLIDSKEIIRQYFENVFNGLPSEYTKEHFAIFVGTLQNQLDKYRSSYTNAQVLCSKMKFNKGIYFFNDHIIDYFRSMVTDKEYDDIFSIYKNKFNESDQEMVAQTVEALNNNNYNVVNSAKDLFIHRNTLVFRMNKIKEILNIDPIANARDREFLNELAFYFRNQT